VLCSSSFIDFPLKFTFIYPHNIVFHFLTPLDMSIGNNIYNLKDMIIERLREKELMPSDHSIIDPIFIYTLGYGVTGGRRILSPDGRSQMPGHGLIISRNEKGAEVAVHPR